MQVAGKERDVATGQYRGLPGSLLLEGLLSLPALAGKHPEVVCCLLKLLSTLTLFADPLRASSTASFWAAVMA